ncbi:MFS transporter [Pseudoduganella violacea]|uniref:Putative MFS family arabinose efflux permease n=1 Tax=Pseudoduganella violacea TaxID=1715466 RepID=A0A7W5BB30_9BURK|nr:MFS transporter [Pseudoduganella violacea]MBB3119500.1 putative MFS family arabinose efflux permease [Pseudoduganella violacea]
MSALSRSLVLLFAIAAAFSVANVYYAQPLLDAFAADFGFSHANVGLVVTATQIGCALALLLLVPLGDLLDRKRLTMAQLLALCLTLLALGCAASPTLLLLGMLGAGLLGTAMTQGLISYAASVAAPAQRGQVVGTVQAGVMLGLLLARVLSGAVADVAGWRAVYFLSAALSAIMLLALRRALPQQQQQLAAAGDSAPRLRYGQLLLSMFTLLKTERTLQVRGTLGLLLFAALNIFWSALVLLLSAPPYALSHTAIGAFGLIGAAGALGAARAGALADRGLGQRTSGAALLLMLAAWLPLAWGATSLAALVLGIILLDLAAQALHVTNQSMILSGTSQAHSRLIGGYMLFYAAGSGAGAIATTSIHAAYGWSGVCMLGAGVSLAALIFWRATLPRVKAVCEAIS